MISGSQRYRLQPGCPTCLRGLTADAATHDLSPRSVFIRAKKLEQQYITRLRTIARAIDHLIRGFDVTNPRAPNTIEEALNQYSRALAPWARAVGHRMVSEVAQRDERSWFRVASIMGRELRQEIQNAPTGQVMRQRLEEQVTLITSLPLEAAQRVHHLALEARIKGTRADKLAAEILRTGEVTKARADMIARTEVSRTATELTKARAEYVGSPGYIWQTATDSDVRPSHKKLNGTFHKWSEPPLCDPPDHRAHPGAIFNCRCIPLPVLPGDKDYERYQ